MLYFDEKIIRTVCLFVLHFYYCYRGEKLYNSKDNVCQLIITVCKYICVTGDFQHRDIRMC